MDEATTPEFEEEGGAKRTLVVIWTKQGEVNVRKINVAEDIVPIGEFKTHASQLVRHLHATGRPVVITQNGKPTAVVVTPAAFEERATTLSPRPR